MRISRASRSRFAEWWFTADFALFAAVLALIAASFVFSLAASPAIAMKKGLPAYYFVERHFLYSLAGIAILWTTSLLAPSQVRRLAAGLFLASLAGLLAVLFTGEEVNGARRWLEIGGHSLQPSEFMKPAFVVLSAWMLAEARTRPDMPALPLALGGLTIVVGLFAAQPDVGQALLIASVWLILFFLSGQPVRRAALLFGIGAAGLGLAYATFGHVQARINRFLDHGLAGNFQIEQAAQSFIRGGFLGRGPGEGTIKTALPDAHSDFIFAVVAEEYGAAACLILLGIFAFIVLRALWRGAREPAPADRLAITGLALLFGLQALTNMAVNVGLLPAKGLTLPFISSGGSSILATSIGVGMLLALARRRPSGAGYRDAGEDARFVREFA